MRKLIPKRSILKDGADVWVYTTEGYRFKGPRKSAIRWAVSHVHGRLGSTAMVVEEDDENTLIGHWIGGGPVGHIYLGGAQ